MASKTFINHYYNTFILGRDLGKPFKKPCKIKGYDILLLTQYTKQLQATVYLLIKPIHCCSYCMHLPTINKM